MIIQYEFYLNRPHDFHEFIRVIEQADIEREYIETMQTVAQHLREEGMQQGMQAGIYQANRENTKRMIAKRYRLDDIREITGPSQEEIEALQSE
jgi:predicted transposase/invertase (TIGR01784 family)